MVPTAAISLCLRKSLDVSGRASRSEFWWFAPVGLLPPVLFAFRQDLFVATFWDGWQLFVILALAVPLLSAAARRLHDTEMPGESVLIPFAPFFVVWLGYQTVYWVALLVGHIGSLPITITICFFAMLFVFPVFLVAFIVSVFAAASLIGHLLVPSDPGTNRYGSDPHEVTP